MIDEARAIEEFFRRRYGRDALYLPSGRTALYLAFREWLRPGDRVLMSPVNDDVVFFVVLAAGLVPVLGPVDAHTGNLDPTAIEDSTWSGLRGVLTTNLYGIPDRMDLLEERCRRHDLVLVEDVAHAIDSRWDGRRIGQFGVAAAYSLSKHLGVVGGVLTFSEAGRRESLARRTAEQIRHRSVPAAIAHRTRSFLSAVGASTRPTQWLVSLRNRLVPRPPERSGYRMRYEMTTVRQAQQEGGGLDRFDRWIRVDNHAYRTWPLPSSRQAALRRLDTFEENRRRRLAGTLRLVESGLAPAGLPVPSDTALFRVPLFVRDRDKVRAYFARRQLALDYIYHPPLDVYAPELTEPVAPSSSAEQWSRDVLPVDPLVADRFLALLGESPGLCQPVTEAICEET
ncbi:MAG TPA: DegT/DnrJ/EryC1/StrS family aminotransferase [Gemmatimonadales bacterium]|nr:DegT/DnrJ/EryC1/StrS family aminotransferase [Gemmatimonadales bacterium]